MESTARRSPLPLVTLAACPEASPAVLAAPMVAVAVPTVVVLPIVVAFAVIAVTVAV